MLGLRPFDVQLIGGMVRLVPPAPAAAEDPPLQAETCTILVSSCIIVRLWKICIADCNKLHSACRQKLSWWEALQG